MKFEITEPTEPKTLTDASDKGLVLVMCDCPWGYPCPHGTKTVGSFPRCQIPVDKKKLETGKLDVIKWDR